MRFLGRTGAIFESLCDDGHFSVEWDILNFHSMSKKGGDYYESPEFGFSSALWCLSLYSDGMIRRQPSGWVGLFLERTDSGPPVTLQFTICIRGAEGVEKRLELKRTFTRHCTIGMPEFLPRQVLRDHQSLMMPEGILTISCRMMRTVPNNATGISSHLRNRHLWDRLWEAGDEFRSSRARSVESQSSNDRGISSYRGHQYPFDPWEVDGEFGASSARSGGSQSTNVKGTGSGDAILCKICMDRERGVVFQPCGHLISCWQCSNLIADCPICRRRITHKIKTYFS